MRAVLRATVFLACLVLCGTSASGPTRRYSMPMIPHILQGMAGGDDPFGDDLDMTQVPGSAASMPALFCACLPWDVGAVSGRCGSRRGRHGCNARRHTGGWI